MLAEAESGPTQGRRLGPVGGRIVAEVLIGLMQLDPTSFLGSNPNWSPEFAGPDCRFRMADLLRIAAGGFPSPDDDGDLGDDPGELV